MNEPKRFKNKKHITASGVWTAAALLLICVMMLSSVTGTCIALFSEAKEPDTVISLLPPDEKAADMRQKKDAADISTAQSVALPLSFSRAVSVRQPSAIAFENSLPDFGIGNDGQQWGGETDIDLFRVSYENGAGMITAAGKNGDKIVAPGTSGGYLLHFTNDGDAAIDYTMKISATLSDDLREYSVPVKVRLSDEDGTWLCGSAEKWESFPTLNGITKSSVVGAKCYSAYTFEWEWPYESGDDAFDTMLANLASEQELALTVSIDITAEYDPDPNAGGGNPQTGDNSHIELCILLMILSLIGFIVILILGKRRAKRDEV